MISRVKFDNLFVSRCLWWYHVSGPGPDPYTVLVTIYLISLWMANGEIQYTSYVFAFHLVRDRAVAKGRKFEHLSQPKH